MTWLKSPGSAGNSEGSSVTSSAINGNILVNGQELKVYNDTELKQSLTGKANTEHTHTLSNIRDVDVTNKTDGNALIYDSTLGKFISKPLPAVSSPGATKLDELSDVDVTTTLPVEGNVLKFEGGTWKPSSVGGSTAGSSPALTYIIELGRWGIKNDNTDYLNTTKGIQNALNWAAANGYNHAFLQNGRYSIGNPGIIMPSNMHFELAPECSLEMVTNSYSGYSIVSFKQVHNSKITGGTIKGDVETHLFEIYTTFVRGGVNTDGSLNSNPNFIRTAPLDRRNPRNGILEAFRLWKPTGASTQLTATGYNFYQYKDTVSSGTFVNYRNNGVFAPQAPTGRGWFSTIDQANQIIFTIDITNTPMTDAEIAKLSAKLDTQGYTHEWGMGISIEASRYIEVANMEIYDCTGDGVYTGWVYSDDPALYTLDGNIGHHIYIHDCNIHNCRRQGVSLCGPNDIYLYNNEIHHIGYKGTTFSSDNRYFVPPSFGIDIESMVGESNMPYKKEKEGIDGLEVNYRITISNNYVHHNNRGHFVNPDGTHVTLENNIFEGSNIGGVISYDQLYISYVNNVFKDTELTVSGSNFVNGAVLSNSGLKLADVRGAVINDVQIKNGRFYGSALNGYFGAPASVDVAAGRFTYSFNHGMGNTAQLSFEQWKGRVPAGINVDKTYYAANVTENSFQVSETPNGPPVVITDAGAPGFNISRYDYGKAYISNVVIERDSFDTSNPPDVFDLLLAGGVVKNVTARFIGINIACPDNYVGRPAVIDGLVSIEGGANIQGCHISNSKFLRSKSRGMEPNISLGVFNSLYTKVNVDGCLFQNLGVDLGHVLMQNSTLINSTLHKVNSTETISTVIKSYLENSSLSLHWIDSPVVTIAQSIFDRVSVDNGKGVSMIQNLDLTTGTT